MKINIISTTTDSEKTSQKLAEYMVKNKLSPCVQIIPQIVSTFNWKNKLKSSVEYLLIIKALQKNVQECKKSILEIHNYDIPEIIVTEVKILNQEYKEWFLDNSTK